MKSLLKYFDKLKKECVLGPLFKLLEASFELLIPLVIAGIIDTGIAGGDKNYIIKMVLIMVLLGVIGLTCSLTAQFFSAKAATSFSAKVRSALFEHIQSLSYAEIDKVGTSTLITRMTSDINQLQSGVNMTLRLFLRSPFIVFGAMFMAFTIDKKSSIIFLVVIVLLSIVVYGIMLITIPMQKKVQSGLDKVLERTRDNLSGVRVIRAFRQEDEQQEFFGEDNNNLRNIQLKTGYISGLTNPVTYVIINLGTAYLIYRGALKVDSGILSQGQVVALVNYMSQILVELIKLAGFILLDIKALASADRIKQIFDIQGSVSYGDKEAKDADVNAAEHMVFDNVSFAYEKASGNAISDISFTAKKGETIGIIGGTGSGKSTLINLIARSYDAKTGKVLLGGRDIKDYSEKTLRSTIGVVPQKAVLFSGTIRENMKWGNEGATDDMIREALKSAMAYEFVEQKEGELDFELLQKGKNLSGGQRQRLTIARALVMNPEILILDDSSSALDAITDKALRSNILALKNRPTTFIVSQRTASVMEADKILVLDDGRLVGSGTHKELLESCQVYKEIYDSQFSA